MHFKNSSPSIFAIQPVMKQYTLCVRILFGIVLNFVIAEAVAGSRKWVTIQNQPPDCTTTTIPLEGQTDLEVDARFEWNAAARASGYFIKIGSSTNSEDILPTTDVGNNTTYVPSDNLPFKTTLFVTIIPYNTFGLASGCPSVTFTTEDEPFVEPTTPLGFSPNGDGINDEWKIANIENYPENEVFIYNRWGGLVFRIRSYDNNQNVFKGIANQGTELGGNELPEGTYFYQVTNVTKGAIDRPKGMVVLKR